MKFIRVVFFILITVLASQLSYAQKYDDFEDVFEAIQNLDDFSGIIELRDFQMYQPNFPLTYFEMARRIENKLYTINPITYSSDFQFTANDLHVYYSLAKGKMDERVFKKYKNLINTHLLNNLKDPSLNDYFDVINKRMEKCDRYVEQALKTHDVFIQFVESYQDCIDEFTTLNNDYSNLKILYLLANKDIIARMDSLVGKFDVSIKALKEYQELSALLSPVLVSPVYDLIAINNYQIDGITSTSMLKEHLSLWDYRTWVNQFKAVLKNEIANLRQKIEDNDRKLDANIQYFSINESFDDKLKYYQTSDELKNLIKKFDYTPLPVSIFDYKMNKLNFLVTTRKQINNPEYKGNKVSFFERVTYYCNLVEQKIKLDDEVQELSLKVTDANIAKYADHFEIFYHGNDGLIRYLNQELNNNNLLLSGAFKQYKTFFLQEENNFRNNYQFVNHLGTEIPVFITNYQLDNLAKGEYHTKEIKRVGLSNNFVLTGVHVTLNNEIRPYLAFTDSLKKARWFVSDFLLDSLGKTVNSAPVSVMVVDSNKIELLVHTIPDSGFVNAQNIILEIDSTGKVFNKIVLDEGDYPRYFYYDEINEKFLVAFKGTMDTEYSNEMETLTIAMYDRTSKLWDFNFEMMGSLIDIVHTNDNLLVFSNFNRYSRVWGEGELVRLADDSPGANNVMSLFISNKGKFISENNYLRKTPFFGVKVLKVNSNNINVVCFDGQKPKNDYRNFIYNNQLVYLLTDPKGQVEYQNFSTP
ncbi:MAG: hypothetical protein ACERKD_23760 [Prolixibacteraceae bacterium]